MTLSLLRKRYFGASWASRSVKGKKQDTYWSTDKISFYWTVIPYSQHIGETMNPSSYLLRSWILRRMKKMRMAMSTMAMPAPITIPTIWRGKRIWGELNIVTAWWKTRNSTFKDLDFWQRKESPHCSLVAFGLKYLNDWGNDNLSM